MIAKSGGLLVGLTSEVAMHPIRRWKNRFEERSRTKGAHGISRPLVAQRLPLRIRGVPLEDRAICLGGGAITRHHHKRGEKNREHDGAHDSKDVLRGLQPPLGICD
jgi:hypothetical protein